MLNEIIIDDGTKEVPIKNKYGKLICNLYIRPADYSIIDRYQEIRRTFDDIIAPLKDIGIKNDGTAEFENEWSILKDVEKKLKEKIDYLFDIEEADEIFAKRNPFSSIGGRFFVEAVFDAIGQLVEQSVKKEAKLTKKHMDKYLKDMEAENARGASEGA